MRAQFFVVFSAAIASSLAYPTLYASPVAPIPAIIPAPVPAVLKSQYHAQDELGQYTYGYTDGLSAKSESKRFDGLTVGAYSYLDSNGAIQNVNYVSDAAGFRVAASNLPVAPPAPPLVAPAPVVDTPEVAAAKAAHLSTLKEEEAKAAAAPEAPATPEEPEEIPASETPATEEPAPAAPPAPAPGPAAVETKAAPAPAPVPVPAPALVPAAIPVPAAVPAVIPYAAAAAPIAPIPGVYAAPAPIISAPLTSQYHSQDEIGQYSYGYIGGPSSKAELKTFDGVTRGGYSYLDANGLVQSANYISDPVNGFRVAASNLPVAPAPVVIPDSPEVAEAKAKHFTLLAKAAAEAAEKPE